MEQERKRTTTVIPAAPGYLALSVCCDAGGVEILTMPIIAWEVFVEEHEARENFRWVTPIPADNCGFDAVLRPDGQVFRNEDSPWCGSSSGGDFFDSIDAFKAAVIKQVSARKQKADAGAS